MTAGVCFAAQEIGPLMKKIILSFLALSSLCLTRVFAADEPRGSVLELHSCELYAGGCVVSSEATLGGRYMLQAWNFTGGAFRGTPLAGLQVAALLSGGQNLAEPKSEATDVIVYVPEKATQSQRSALVSWLKSTEPKFQSARLQTRAVPMKFARTQSGYTFSAGKAISVKTASLESCEKGSCGESLWYSPRAATSVFTVAVNNGSHVTEPLLKLQWDEAGQRSIFLGKFGEDKADNLFVTASDLCGPAEKLF